MSPFQKPGNSQFFNIHDAKIPIEPVLLDCKIAGIHLYKFDVKTPENIYLDF